MYFSYWFPFLLYLVLDVIQYTANLTVQFDQILGNNLTIGANSIIQIVCYDHWPQNMDT